MQDDLYFGVITGPMVPWHIPASLRAGGEGGSGSRFWEAGEDRLVGALKSTPCSPTQTIILVESLEEGFNHSLSTCYGAPGFLTPFSMVLVWHMVPSAAGMLLVMQRLLLLRHHNSLQTSWKERDFGGERGEGGRKRQRNKVEIRIRLC